MNTPMDRVRRTFEFITRHDFVLARVGAEVICKPEPDACMSAWLTANHDNLLLIVPRGPILRCTHPGCSRFTITDLCKRHSA